MALDAKRLLEAAAPMTAEWVGLRRMRLAQRSYEAKNGRFESATDATDEGYLVEVLSGGQFGYACLSSPDPDAARAAGLRALELARAASPLAIHRFTTSVRPATKLRWENGRRQRARLSADFLAGHAVALSKAMQVSDKIVQASAILQHRDEEIEIVSTSGAELWQATHIVEFSIQAIAREGNIIQRRTANGPRGRCHQGGQELVDTEAELLDARRVAEEAIELLGAGDCPSGRMDLVLAPDQMMLQIHESVGHPLELDRILGDERNFAGWSFVKLSDIGSLRYGSDLMNVTFDPDLPGEPASYAADDIGNPARREYIIKDGILVRGLGSLESQERSGKPGVANQRSHGWWRAPIDRMANLNLEPGNDSIDSIIGSIEKGVYMEANRSWSIDDYRNKFQFGCEYGKLIIDGKLGKTVKNPNYRGISASFWNALFKVGDPSTFRVYGTPNCGKGEPSQMVTVGHASPVCAFRGVEVFGGEA
jgi:predicted Zn-dependent protease